MGKAVMLRGQWEPTGQGLQLALLVAELLGLYHPTPQGVQWVAPVPLQLPTGHTRGTPVPLPGQKDPASQVTQVLAEVAATAVL